VKPVLVEKKATGLAEILPDGIEIFPDGIEIWPDGVKILPDGVKILPALLPVADRLANSFVKWATRMKEGFIMD